MIIADKMTKNPTVAYEDTSIKQASDIMYEKKYDILPVLDEFQHLVGVVTLKDIMLAAPSPASTLSTYELRYLLDKLTVSKIMQRNPVSIEKDTPIEEAILLMVENNFDALVVKDGENVVGIVSKIDLFGIMLELFGAKHHGVRVECLVEDSKGQAAKVSQLFADNGLNIFSMGTLEGKEPGTKILTFKLENAKLAQVKKLVKPIVKEITDIREV